MGNELTIDDLADGGSSDGGSSGPDGEWITGIVDKLDEKGLLEPLIFGPDAAQDVDSMTDDIEPSDAPNTDSMDADAIKALLLNVYDNAGMIPGLSEDPTLSELIKLVDAQPDLVNKLIDKHL